MTIVAFRSLVANITTHHIITLHAEVNCSGSRLSVIIVQLKGLLIAAPRPPGIVCHLPVIMSKVAKCTTKVWVQLCSLKS